VDHSLLAGWRPVSLSGVPWHGSWHIHGPTWRPFAMARTMNRRDVMIPVELRDDGQQRRPQGVRLALPPSMPRRWTHAAAPSILRQQDVAGHCGAGQAELGGDSAAKASPHCCGGQCVIGRSLAHSTLDRGDPVSGVTWLI
jgi:hypothetical protein